MLVKVLQEPLEGRIREALLVGKVDILKDAHEPQVGILDLGECVIERRANVLALLANVLPKTALGDIKAMLVRVGRLLLIPIKLLEVGLVLLHPNIGETLKEQQAKDVVLEITRVDGPAQNVRRAPQVPLELLQRHLLAGPAGLDGQLLLRIRLLLWCSFRHWFCSHKTGSLTSPGTSPRERSSLILWDGRLGRGGSDSQSGGFAQILRENSAIALAYL